MRRTRCSAMRSSRHPDSPSADGGHGPRPAGLAIPAAAHCNRVPARRRPPGSRPALSTSRPPDGPFTSGRRPPGPPRGDPPRARRGRREGRADLRGHARPIGAHPHGQLRRDRRGRPGAAVRPLRRRVLRGPAGPDAPRGRRGRAGPAALGPDDPRGGQDHHAAQAGSGPPPGPSCGSSTRSPSRPCCSSRRSATSGGRSPSAAWSAGIAWRRSSGSWSTSCCTWPSSSPGAGRAAPQPNFHTLSRRIFGHEGTTHDLVTPRERGGRAARHPRRRPRPLRARGQAALRAGQPHHPAGDRPGRGPARATFLRRQAVRDLLCPDPAGSAARTGRNDGRTWGSVHPRPRSIDRVVDDPARRGRIARSILVRPARSLAPASPPTRGSAPRPPARTSSRP